MKEQANRGSTELTGSAEQRARSGDSATDEGKESPAGPVPLSDEELDDVIGGVSTNWEFDW